MAGYSALLKDHQCTISNLRGLVLGQVPLKEGLYKYVYTPKTSETANLTQKTLSLDDLHWHMGHAAAKKLVKDGHIVGLLLEMSSEASFCKACTKAKLTCKPVPKEHRSPHVTNHSEKVHSDVWGPSNP